MGKLVNIAASYVVGGGVVERYEGATSFDMNVGSDDSDDEIIQNASERAKSIVAKSGCWSPGLVNITDVSIAKVY